MLKKLLAITSITLLSTTTSAMETSSFYVSPSLLYKTGTAGTSSTREMSARFALGYGGIASQGMYIAAETFLIPNSVQLRNNTGSDGISIKTSYSYGLSAIPGLMISDATMVFLRLGVIKTRFSTVNKKSLGWQSGIGIQTGLTPSWDLRGEYTYTAYHSVPSIGSPVSDWFGLGAIYKFG